MGHKIKTLVDITDKDKNQIVKSGEIVDFGVVRNKKAVDSKWAEWHIVKETKETEKKEETPSKTTSKARGKKIEAK